MIGIANIIVVLIIEVMNFTVNKLPVNLGTITPSAFGNVLDNLAQYITMPLFMINQFLPVKELFVILIGIIVFELLLFSIRAFITVWNMLRGSGARI